MKIEPMFFFFCDFPPFANITEAQIGVAFELCPPVLLYISVSTTRTLTSFKRSNEVHTVSEIDLFECEIIKHQILLTI